MSLSSLRGEPTQGHLPRATSARSATKLLAIRSVRSSGYRWLATVHHPRNASAIAMNRRLGSVDQVGEGL
ncbi:hypothetical protein [Streptosporangium sp. NPDC087985]|uniref:hypothetical protein n=1 Tax=Streptosporangium sp. NPDC087985 TaxID=3366196 RepID=UPI0037FCE691